MRYPSIDILRTFAIVLMVLVHFSENLSGKTWAFAGFGAPMFAFLSGISYRLWLDSRERRGASDDAISLATIRRGLFLFFLGFVFNVLVWLPQDTFNWDVLTFIGVATLGLNVARKLREPVVLTAIGLALFLGPVLRLESDYASYWNDGSYDYDPNVTDVLLGFLANGYFPVFPWVAYPLAGFLTAQSVFAPTPDELPRWRGAALLGGTLLLLSFVPAALTATGLESERWLPSRWTMFPPSLTYVLRTFGVCLTTFSLGHRWLDRNRRWSLGPRIGEFFGTFSRRSLSIYLLHHLLHIWPLWIWTALQGMEPTALWRKALPIETAVPLAIVGLAVCWGVARLMEVRRIDGVEGWMRRLCD